MQQMAYVKIYLDWTDATRKLKDQEKGRLMDAIIAYAKGEMGETIESRLTGNEAYVFPMFQLQIDRDRADVESRRETNRNNGLKGGAPAGNQNASKQPKQPKTTENNPNNPYKDYDYDNRQETKTIENRQSIINDDDTGADAQRPSLTMLTAEDVAQGIALDQRIEAAARNIGLQVTSAAMQKAHSLGGSYGYDELIDAIGKAVDCPKWSYVEGILRNKDTPKPVQTRHNRQTYTEDKIQAFAAKVKGGAFLDA